MCEQPSQLRSQDGGGAATWVRPSVDVLKCNVDASLFEDNRFGIGLCIQNSEGLFVKVKSAWYYGTPQPHEVEALGVM